MNESKTDLTVRELAIQMEGIKVLLEAKLDAQKEATTTAFAASEKAIVKAEAAQSDYNVRSNEFRGQLDDQAKTLMPRAEALAKFEAMDQRVEEIKKRYDTEISSLRESRSESGGKSSGISVTWGVLVIVIIIAISIVALFWSKHP